jgi:hypothetical protein
MAIQNFYGLTGAVSNPAIYATDPETFLAAYDDFETITLTWDESNIIGDFLRIQMSPGTEADGMVATDGTVNVVGTGTKFKNYREGDLILIDGETSRKIDLIIDDFHLRTDVPCDTTDDTLSMFVSDNDWTELAAPALGVETLEVGDLTESTVYFFKLSTHYRLKWSAWKVHYAVSTPAQ